MQDLGALEGDTESEAVAINNRGDVVGHSTGAAGTRAFLWTRDEAMQDLGTFPSGDYSRALAINDRGDVVGTSTSALGLRAVLWTKAGGMQDLNSSIPAGAGFVLATAVAINAQGAIVALGHVDAGHGHGHGNHDVPTRVILLRAPTLGTNRKPPGPSAHSKAHHHDASCTAHRVDWWHRIVGGGLPPWRSSIQSVFGRWSSAPQLPWFPTAAHLLPTGQVLIYSGDPEGIPPGVPGTTQRLWSPSSGTTTSIPGSGYDLFCSGHAFLADGRLLFAGGHTENFVGLRSASTYDPFANTWTRLPDMNAGRWYPTNTTLANGDALVVSGSIDNTVGVNRLPQVFQAASSTWRDLTTALLGLDLYPQMHLAPNGRVFSVAPSEVTRYLDAAGTGAWSVVANRNSGYRDYGSSVLYADGKVLHLGGGDPPTNAAEVIDLNQAVPTWRSVPPMAIARRQLNATILPDGKVLVTGGTSGPGFNNPTTPVFEAEMWDPTTEAWTTMAAAQVPRLYHSVAVLLPDGRIFSAGGNGYSQVEIYEPPYLFKGARPTITLAPASVSHGQTFFVETPQATDIAAVTWIRLPSVTHAFNQNQRINRLGFSQTKGGVNVTAPPN